MARARRRPGLGSAHLALATGLATSGVLVAAIGGWPGVAIGAGQVALGIATLLRPRAPASLAGAALLLLPAPLAAARHWTARVPLTCRCIRLAHPPGLVSWTGMAVALDLSLFGLALWLAARARPATVGKSSP